MKLVVRPLTAELLPALEDLFADSAMCSKCWCMYWRVGSAYRKQPARDNRKAFRAVVKSGPPPGLLAFDGALAIGWCQVTPRDALPWLERPWRMRRVDDAPVWSISCFYVRKGYRRQGITRLLIDAALEAAKHAKAPALEAYPLDRALSPSATSTGIVSTFARAGFKVVARHAPERPIMRYEFRPPKAQR
jgi:GNAT superfamily N-acetyltransferase